MSTSNGNGEGKNRAARAALKEYNKAKNRSFGQAAIAYYLEKLDGIELSEEVLLTKGRRFRIDVSVKDTFSGKTYAIEHDSDKYHSSRRESDAEKDAIAREKYDEVIHIIQSQSRKSEEKNGVYTYYEGKIFSIEGIIRRLISEKLGRCCDVDIKRDTMKILRKKGYVSTGRTRWNELIFARLNEDFRPEDNEGFQLSDFPPRAYYNALWRCRDCGHTFIAAISNRARGTLCAKCKNRRKKPPPHESFAAYYPEKALNWSAENPIRPTDVTKRSSYVALWKCRVCAYEWRQQVSVVAGLNTSGCDRCGKEAARIKKFKRVEKLNPNTGEVLFTYNSISDAKADGFPKVQRAIVSGICYKGFIFRLERR